MNWLALALVLFAGAAVAQQPRDQAINLPVNQFLISPQVTAVGVSNLVFTAPRKALYGFTVVTGGSAGFALVIDGTAVPSNGALSGNNLPVHCMHVPANDTRSSQWLSPILLQRGIVVVFSTGANCDTLVASSTVKIMGQAL